MQMARKRASSSQLTGYLRHKLEEHLSKTGESAASVASRANFTPAQLSQFRSGTRGAGWLTVAGLSRALGLALSDIERDAEAWGKDHPESHKQDEETDRYPTRAATVRWGIACGFPHDAIEQLKSWRFHGPDPGGEYWANLLMVIAKSPGPLGSPIESTPPPDSSRLAGPPKQHVRKRT
jgi:transcriptional regulator with XRE-family HTH domain